MNLWELEKRPREQCELDANQRDEVRKWLDKNWGLSRDHQLRLSQGKEEKWDDRYKGLAEGHKTLDLTHPYGWSSGSSASFCLLLLTHFSISQLMTWTPGFPLTSTHLHLVCPVGTRGIQLKLRERCTHSLSLLGCRSHSLGHQLNQKPRSPLNPLSS